MENNITQQIKDLKSSFPAREVMVKHAKLEADYYENLYRSMVYKHKIAELNGSQAEETSNTDGEKSGDATDTSVN